MSPLMCDEAQELVPLLALDVLDVDERDVLEDHLTGCTLCRADAAAYAEIAAEIALALPQSEPSAGTKARLLQAARSNAPIVEESRRREPIPMARRMRRWRVSLAGLVAAAALVLGAGSTAWALSLRSELDAQGARIAQLTERANNYGRVTAVLQAADTQVRVLQGTGQAPEAFGRVYIDPDTSEGMLMVRGLPQLPAGRVYQLWVAGSDGQRESAGLLTWTDRQGNGYTLIQCPQKLARWQTFGVTQEPAGGSPGPTGPGYLRGSI